MAEGHSDNFIVPSFLVGCLVLVADQFIKIFVSKFLDPADTIPLINNVLHVTFVRNSGCAFGLFNGQNLIFPVTTAILALALFVYCFIRRDKTNAILRLAAILIIFGAASNLIDRFRVGHVIDFIDLRVWPVFNFADSAITTGAAIFIFEMAIKREKRKT